MTNILLQEAPVREAETKRTGPLLEVSEFYDQLAPEYDLMTDPVRREAAERPYFRMLVEKYAVHTALDAGAGTGFHSILLSRLGVDVTAVDSSPRMIERLRSKSAKEAAHVTGLTADLRELSNTVPGPFDAVFCMGNTLAHVSSAAELDSVLGQFAKVLKPGGTSFIQILNYERILSLRPRILNVRSTAGRSFMRSYGYEPAGSPLPGPITFEISMTGTGEPAENREIAIRLNPILPTGMMDALRRSGFESIMQFGSISLERFNPGSSTDLFIIARRGRL